MEFPSFTSPPSAIVQVHKWRMFCESCLGIFTVAWPDAQPPTHCLHCGTRKPLLRRMGRESRLSQWEQLKQRALELVGQGSIVVFTMNSDGIESLNVYRDTFAKEDAC